MRVVIIVDCLLLSNATITQDFTGFCSVMVLMLLLLLLICQHHIVVGV